MLQALMLFFLFAIARACTCEWTPTTIIDPSCFIISWNHLKNLCQNFESKLWPCTLQVWTIESNWIYYVATIYSKYKRHLEYLYLIAKILKSYWGCHTNVLNIYMFWSCNINVKVHKLVPTSLLCCFLHLFIYFLLFPCLSLSLWLRVANCFGKGIMHDW